MEDLEARLGRRNYGDKILFGVAPEDSEAYEDHHSQVGTFCGGEDELPTGLQNLPEEANQYPTSNNLLDQQQDFPAATASALEISGVDTDEGRVGREERYERIEAEEEELKRASKFAHSTTGIAGAGIISIFSGYLGDQTGHANTVHLKVCTFFMLATFISGFSMLLLIWHRRSYRISIKIFTGLKATTLVFLSLAMFDVSFLFLKIFTILAFVPALVIVMIAFFMALCC